ncbi:MAG: response regulator [Methanoregula sp.]|nr:response regulator [Methanoregula sp.]
MNDEEKKIKILVVEDELLIGLDIQESLMKLGYEVPDIAISGEGALDAVEKEKPDIVLMDIYLQGNLDGIQAAKIIRDRDNIPVIYLTAYSDHDLLKKARETTPYGYMLKPFDCQQARASIEMALGKHAVEENLKYSERTKKVLLNATPDSLFLINGNGVIIALNEAMAKRIGKPVGEILGLHYLDPLISTVTQVKKEDIDATILLKTPFHKEKEYNGRWFDISIYPVHEQPGRISDLAIYCHDITPHKEAIENQLRIAKLESLGLLAGGIAHQFNNILTKVLGNISLVQSLINDYEEASLRLSAAAEEVYQARQLTGRLLTFSRGGEPVRKITDIVPLIEGAVQHTVSGAAFTVTYSIEKPLPKAFIDNTQITEALFQILENAVHSMEKGGTIQIGMQKELVPVTTPLLKSGEYLVITVKDEGTGIPAENLSKVFDIYFTTQTGRHGLGLPITLSIIRRHGGDIMFTSEPGKGTKVKIYIPVAEPELPRESMKKSVIHVLIMDDEFAICDIASTFLTQKGYLVTTASRGEEAIDMYLSAMKSPLPVDVVILDLIIPAGLGGVETMDALKRVDSGVRAIVSSGYSDDPVMANPRRYGFSGILPKPYRLSDLDATIREIASEKPSV